MLSAGALVGALEPLLRGLSAGALLFRRRLGPAGRGYWDPSRSDRPSTHPRRTRGPLVKPQARAYRALLSPPDPSRTEQGRAAQGRLTGRRCQTCPFSAGSSPGRRRRKESRLTRIAAPKSSSRARSCVWNHLPDLNTDADNSCRRLQVCSRRRRQLLALLPRVQNSKRLINGAFFRIVKLREWHLC